MTYFYYFHHPVPPELDTTIQCIYTVKCHVLTVSVVLQVFLQKIYLKDMAPSSWTFAEFELFLKFLLQ